MENNRKLQLNHISKDIRDLPIWINIKFGGIAIAFIFVIDILYYISCEKFDWAGVLVEAHGLIFDIILFGFVIAFYQYKRDEENKKFLEFQSQKAEIERYKEEIDDYRPWKDSAVNYRLMGIIRRLVNLGCKDINLAYTNLKGVRLGDIELNRSIFDFAELNNCEIRNFKFINCSFRYTDLTGSQFIKCAFENCRFNGAKIGTDTILNDVTLVDCDLDTSKVSII